MITYTSQTTSDDRLVLPSCYYRIWGFMTGEMQLKKTELLVYALIYSYFKSAQPFTGSQKYIAEFTGAGKSATEAALKSLLQKGLIAKRHIREYGRDHIEYSIVVEALPNISIHKDMHNMLAKEKGGGMRNEE